MKKLITNTWKTDLSKQFWCLSYCTKSSILQLRFEIHFSYIFIFCLDVFVFAWLLSYQNSFPAAFLAIKINRCWHVSYMQVFDYLCIHNIYNIDLCDLYWLDMCLLPEIISNFRSLLNYKYWFMLLNFYISWLCFVWGLSSYILLKF